MAEHLGIAGNRVLEVTVEAKPNAILKAHIAVALNQDDLAAIAERMKAAVAK